MIGDKIDYAINMISEGKKDEAIDYLNNIAKPHKRGLANSPAQILKLCADMELLTHEEMRLLLLDNKNRLLRQVLISRGTIDKAFVFIRDIIREVLLINAGGFVLVHNHPSGEIQPSAEDNILTRKVKEAADLVGLIFLDHIIIGSNETYYSYMAEGAL